MSGATIIRADIKEVKTTNSQRLAEQEDDIHFSSCMTTPDRTAFHAQRRLLQQWDGLLTFTLPSVPNCCPSTSIFLDP